MINVLSEGIKVEVRFNNGQKMIVADNFDSPNLEKINGDTLKERFGRNYSSQYLEDLFNLKKYWNQIKSEKIVVSSKNISIATPILLPLIAENNLINSLAAYPTLARGGVVSIDGIIIKEYKKLSELIEVVLQKDINNNQPFLINFHGEIRPKLSVDRLTITEVPAELKEELNVLISELKFEIFKKIIKYVEEKKLLEEHSDIILEKILNSTKIFKLDIIEMMAKNDKDIPKNLFPKLIRQFDVGKNMLDFFNSGKFRMKRGFFLSEFNKQEWILYLSKLVYANRIEVNEDFISIESSESLKICDKLNDYYLEGGGVPFLVYGDCWPEAYQNYDLVTELYPIISKNLFDHAKVDCYEKKIKINDRVKWIGATGNGLSGIGALESLMLIPDIGFGQLSKREWYNKKEPNRVLNYSYITKNYWLFELNDNGRTIVEENKDYFLRVFISPSVLSDDEEKLLEKKKENHELYYTGVINGWSVLFLGKTEQMSFTSGLVEISELLQNIPSEFPKDSGINYHFVDNSKWNL